MASPAFKSLIDGVNAQIRILNENNLRVYDEENTEYFITGIEYNQEDDKLIFKTDEDPNELNRLEELKKEE